MAQKIKNFWLKFGTMLLTLYFMPLSDFIMGFFGARGLGVASAGTLTCARATMNCPGTADKMMSHGEVASCNCADTSKTFTAMCSIVFGDEDQGGFRTGECVSKEACSPNGSTKDCSSSIQYGTKTCTNGIWGSCIWGSCKSGYVMVSNTCHAICSIGNGSGYDRYFEEPSSSSTEA